MVAVMLLFFFSDVIKKIIKWEYVHFSYVESISALMSKVDSQQAGTARSLADVFPHVLEFLAAVVEPKPPNSA